MARGWSASSLVPGLGGLVAGSGIVTRGTLSGGVTPAGPMNTINSTMPGGTGVPPFVSSALNPFLSAVLGQQAQPTSGATAAPAPNINVADIVRAQNERLRVNEAIRAQGAASWNIDKLQNRINAIPTSWGGMAVGGFGPQRADLQQRMLGFESQLGRAQAGIFGQPMAPMGNPGWSNTFAIPTY